MAWPRNGSFERITGGSWRSSFLTCRSLSKKETVPSKPRLAKSKTVEIDIGPSIVVQQIKRSHIYGGLLGLHYEFRGLPPLL